MAFADAAHASPRVRDVKTVTARLKSLRSRSAPVIFRAPIRRSAPFSSGRRHSETRSLLLLSFEAFSPGANAHQRAPRSAPPTRSGPPALGAHARGQARPSPWKGVRKDGQPLLPSPPLDSPLATCRRIAAGTTTPIRLRVVRIGRKRFDRANIKLSPIADRKVRRSMRGGKRI